MKELNFTHKIPLVLILLFISFLGGDIKAQASRMFPPLQSVPVAKQRILSAMETYRASLSLPLPIAMERKLNFFGQVLITLEDVSNTEKTTAYAIFSNLHWLGLDTHASTQGSDSFLRQSEVVELLNIVKI